MNSTSEYPNRRVSWFRRIAITLLLVGAGVTAAIYSLSHPQHDFIEYWTAARLLVEQHNPYSLNEMFQAQKALGWQQSAPLMFLGPPWTLVFVAPLGLIESYAVACFFWIIALAGMVALSSCLLMDVYFGELHIPEVSDTAFCRCLFAFTFYPVLLCFRFSQTAPLMLLGLAAFLYFDGKHRPILAGAFLSLTLFKPQLLYLVWIALLVRSAQQRRWTMFASAMAVTIVLTLIAFPLDAHAGRQYWDLMRGPYPRVIPSGMVAPIRKLLGGDAFWLQLLPPIAGLVWFMAYWHQHRADWSWNEHMPVLVTASVFTSAYGWLFDQTVLVLPVIALAAQAGRAHGRLPRNAVLLYTVLNCILILVMGFPPAAYLPAPIFLAVVLWREAGRVSKPNHPIPALAV